MKSFLKKILLFGTAYFSILLICTYKVNYLQEEDGEIKKMNFGDYITYFVNDSSGEPEFEKTIFIRTQNEYDELKVEFATNNPKLSNWDSLCPDINFSKNSIVGRSFKLTTCEVGINMYYKVDDFNKNVHLIYSKDRGQPCPSTTFYMAYILVPKIPNDYDVSFPIERYPVPEIKFWIPFTF